MSELRIGLIGAGFIGGTHGAVLRHIADQLPDLGVRLVAVADPDERARAQLAAQCRIERTYGGAAELLDDGDVNTVFLCTPTRFHAEHLAAAAERGLHVFCEKPLAMSYAEGRRMVAGVEAAGVAAQIGLVLRFSAVYGHMRTLLRRPEMGRPLAVLFRDDQCFPIKGLHSSAWRADRTMTAGGTMIEHGVHDVDLVAWMFGPVARLRAWSRNHAGHDGVEDYVAVELDLASGLRAQLVNLWHDIGRRYSNRRLEIFCERGFLASEHDMLGSLVRQVGDGDEETVSAEVVLQAFLEESGRSGHPLANNLGIAYLLQDLSFLEALRAGRPPSPGMREGLEAQRLVEAIYHAARSGEEVDVAGFEPG